LGLVTAFFAGVGYGRSRGYPIEKCLQFGAIVSGLCITSSELAHESLSSEQVEQLYQKYYEE
jgi:sugar/nucleoside kinase (ribokinase family)